ncbi:MAG TPA: tetratricopeptide repeat protein, partial [Thermodesulfobacteriota bacterium]|nr:tetratricopeptide repeat protein [Thermodesulfobacteriota bacterium]
MIVKLRLLLWYSLFLSFLLLVACAGLQRMEPSGPGSPSSQTVPFVSPKKTSPNPLAYYPFLLAQLKLKEGKMDEAIKHLKDAISKDKKEPSLHVELATLYVHKGLLDDAVEECKKALLYDPNTLNAHLMLGG